MKLDENFRALGGMAACGLPKAAGRQEMTASRAMAPEELESGGEG